MDADKWQDLNESHDVVDAVLNTANTKREPRGIGATATYREFAAVNELSYQQAGGKQANYIGLRFDLVAARLPVIRSILLDIWGAKRKPKFTRKKTAKGSVSVANTGMNKLFYNLDILAEFFEPNYRYEQLISVVFESLEHFEFIKDGRCGPRAFNPRIATESDIDIADKILGYIFDKYKSRSFERANNATTKNVKRTLSNALSYLDYLTERNPRLWGISLILGYTREDFVLPENPIRPMSVPNESWIRIVQKDKQSLLDRIRFSQHKSQIPGYFWRVSFGYQRGYSLHLTLLTLSENSDTAEVLEAWIGGVWAEVTKGKGISQVITAETPGIKFCNLALGEIIHTDFE